VSAANAPWRRTLVIAAGVVVACTALLILIAETPSMGVA
jgi:hypothetical protein